MIKHTRADIESVLVDVRKSYRTLYTYQKMVLDLAKYIGDRLSFSYAGGWPKFSGDSPRTGKGALHQSSWDWLNMYYYDFHFSPRSQQASSLKFSIQLISDTGYWLSHTEYFNNKKVERYESPESSGTKLVFILGKDVWTPDLVLKKYENLKTLIGSTEPLFEHMGSGSMLFQVFDLKDFLNADDTDRQLDRFIASCAAHEMTLATLSVKI